MPISDPVVAHPFANPEHPDSPHERVTFVSDEASGMQCVIAIHSTARGPAYGGCRFTRYPGAGHALTDALRLAEGMSLKNALAGLPFGGGKAVLIQPEGSHDRGAVLRAFGDAVESLAGRYITAEDVGTSVADMQIIRSRTRHVGGLPEADGRDGDPSPYTARGVHIAMRAGAAEVFGSADLHGRVIAIQGLGSVGYSLARQLYAEGAKLVVADIDGARTARAATELGASVVGVEQISAVACDVFAPCALGAILNERSIPALRARLICGAANNQLATAADGERLVARGITYLPDYLVNAGGIIRVGLAHLGRGDEATVLAEIERIADRAHAVMAMAARTGQTTARVADAWARQRLHDHDAELDRALLTPECS
ncbi:MAG: Glu/Leu/Phe/Val dehydrogenase dimerization domain-containing protein [Burkholderiaceae bacterium]